MPPERSLASPQAFWSQHCLAIEQLYAEANAARWGLPKEAFAEALHRSTDKRFHGGTPGNSEIAAYWKTVHAADLALACACGMGIEAAWEYFIAQYRTELRRAAASILRASGTYDEARAVELADSLYAELYGLRPDERGQRKSLFAYFHGRSKLSTWLRAVLAQRHLDKLRASTKTVSLDAEPDTGHPCAARRPEPPGPPDPDRERYVLRLGNALSEALRALPGRERMILACYYMDRLTLAEIGRTMREHESTVSRQLDRTRRALREAVADRLRRGEPGREGHAPEPGLDEAQIQQVFEYALQDWPFDLARALSGESSSAEPPG
jgi:RNA polymerase sigma-70 factor